MKQMREKNQSRFTSALSQIDRAKGSIIGTLIGDALGVGPHWYYDLDELKTEYGEWIDTYMSPKQNPRFPDVWKARKGLKPGDVSQTGQVFIFLLESVAENGGYDEADFTERLDGLLDTLDGTQSGGRYTDEAMRDVWHGRKEGFDWPHVGGLGYTPTAAIRTPILAAYYATDPGLVLKHAFSNIELTHRNPLIVGQSLAFAMTVTALISGVPLPDVSTTLWKWNQEGKLSFPVRERKRKRTDRPSPWMMPVTWSELAVEEHNFTDSIGQISSVYKAAKNPAISIEPASAACQLFGLNCLFGFVLPSAYYMVSRFEDDFEMAVLSTINGGGNNMARAALTGALSGALVGLSGIPERFITGLLDHERLLKLAERVARAQIK
jgi:ADP-ribosylglycohydrolase